jgi:hypothetical protein
LIHFALVRPQIGQGVVHLNDIEGAAMGDAIWIFRVQSLLDRRDYLSQGLLANLTHGVQILVPTFRFWEVAKREIGFSFSADVGSIANGSRSRGRKNAGGAGISLRIGVSGRSDFQNGISGGHAHNARNLSGSDSSEGLAQFCAQGRGVDPAHGAAVGGRWVDGEIAGQGGEVLAALQPLHHTISLRRGIHYDDPQLNAVRGILGLPVTSGRQQNSQRNPRACSKNRTGGAGKNPVAVHTAILEAARVNFRPRFKPRRVKVTLR